MRASAVSSDMATPARPDRLLTVEEYLERENRSARRHEYVAGRVYAMTGARIRHALIVSNLVAGIRAAASDGPCRVFTTDLKLRAAHDRVYYPDLMVLCGPLDQGAYVVAEPCVVVEVTSSSTRRTDHGEKLDAYRKMASLLAYFIVEQGARIVERHWRDTTGAWRHERVTDGDLPVPCPATTLSLDAIYEGIELDPIDGPTARRPRRVREGAAAEA